MTDRISDGNGGTIDPRFASDHDLLVIAHIKLDSVLGTTQDHETRLRVIERFIGRVPTVAFFAMVLIAAGLLLDLFYT